MNQSLLNWPDEIDRTPESEREECTKFSTGLRTTRSELKDQMRLLEADEWRVEETSGGYDDPGVVVRWIKDGQEYAAACDAYTTKTGNLREAYKWIKETRMREQRPVGTARDNFAAAELPSGDETDAIALGGESAASVLGISPAATNAEAKEAHRQLIKEVHPDNGGSEQEFKRVKEAYSRFVDVE